MSVLFKIVENYREIGCLELLLIYYLAAVSDRKLSLLNSCIHETLKILVVVACFFGRENRKKEIIPSVQ